MGRPPRIPWDELRDRFVQGEEVVEGGRAGRRWPSTGDLARIYGVDPATVSRATHRERPEGTWIQQREAFRSGLQREADAKVSRAVGNQALPFRLKSLHLAFRLMHLVERNLMEKDPSPRKLNQLARSAQQALKIGLISIGEVAQPEPQSPPEPELSLTDFDRILDAGTQPRKAPRAQAAPRPLSGRRRR